MKGDQHVVYTIIKNVKDSVIVKVQQPDGSYKEVKVNEPGYVAPQNGEEGTPSYEGNKGGASKVSAPIVPPGYKVTGVTLNGVVIPGTDTPEGLANFLKNKASIPKTLGTADANYVYNIAKLEPVTVKIVTGKVVDGKFVTTGVKQVTTTTTNGVKVNGTKDTSVETGLSTDKVNLEDAGIVVPKGYHIYVEPKTGDTGVTVNGKSVALTTTKDGVTIPNTSVIGKIGRASCRERV